MRHLYLDESGDHSLTVIDPQYPVFVLGGVIVDPQYEQAVIAPALRRFKRDLLGRDDIVLHTADIVRQRGPFDRLADPGARERFRTRLSDLMRDLDYVVVACGIRKDAHLAAYGASALDPYMLSLHIVVERFCFALADDRPADIGRIIAERRDQALDSSLTTTWRHIRERGTSFLRAAVVRERVVRLDLMAKSPGHPGLELADLVVSPIGRHIAGKPERPDWAIVESKMRRRHGEYAGAGLVTLPKE
jgi:hypothetical protein